MSEADCIHWMLQSGLLRAVRDASLEVYHSVHDTKSRDEAIKVAAARALAAYEFQLSLHAKARE